MKRSTSGFKHAASLGERLSLLLFLRLQLVLLTVVLLLSWLLLSLLLLIISAACQGNTPVYILCVVLIIWVLQRRHC